MYQENTAYKMNKRIITKEATVPKEQQKKNRKGEKNEF